MFVDAPIALLPNRSRPYPHHDSPGAPLRSRQVVESDTLYRLISSGEPCWISDDRGACRPLHIDRWLGGDESTDDDRRGDEVVLDLCHGPTVDIGCGPGRFTAALAGRGLRALGVDVSATAVEMTVRRGGTAIHRDVFAPMPNSGEWANVLLADGNIGIGGNPLRLLRRCRQLLHSKGVVVAEVDTEAIGVTREYRRWETSNSVSAWFPWAHVGSDAMSALAESAGFLQVSLVHVHGRSMVTLQVA